MSNIKNQKFKAFIDICIIMTFFSLAMVAYGYFQSHLSNMSGFKLIIAYAVIQFCSGGIGVFIVLILRRETPSIYGLNTKNIKNSFVTGIIFSVVYIIFSSINKGQILWIPLRTHSTTIISTQLDFPFNLLGILITIMFWGIVEGFYYIVISKKIDVLVKNPFSNIWLSPGPIIFAFVNVCIHLLVYSIEGRLLSLSNISNIILSFMSYYLIIMVSKKSNNAWGGILMHTLINGIGSL